MAVRAALLGACLVAAAAAAKLVGSQGAGKERPVMKVIRLLQDMQAELQQELEDDRAVYEQLTCWCKDNDREKSAAIEMANQQIEQLEASLSADAAKVRELKAKRAETVDEIASDQKALDTATALRFKENKAFHAEEVDLIEAIKACKQAVVVLSKHHPSLTQVQSAARLLQSARVQELALSAGSALGRAGSKALREFVQGAMEGNPAFLGVPGYQSYAPQSGQIFGILKQMQADFEASLSDAQKAEEKAEGEFAALRTAKTEELEAGKSQVVEIDAQVAALGEKSAQETKELEDTEAQLALDTEFLANLRKKCTMTDEEFQARTKSRTEEIAAVEETIAILNSDEAFNLFDKTVAASFLQSSSASAGGGGRQAEQRTRAALVDVLRHGAAVSGAPVLSLLAASAQLDAFTKVKAEIDKLVAELSEQQKDEVAHRDWCIKELAANNRSTEASYDKKDALQTKMADLEKELKAMGEKMEEVKAASAEAERQMKRASEVREAENADFQLTVGDQRMTQVILQKALARMKQVYAALVQEEPQPGAPHIQTSGNHTDPGNGPARFSKYEKHAGGGRVVAMIERVIADSHATEDEAIASEQDAQAAYENFMKDSNKSLRRYAETLVNLSEAKATATSSHILAETDLKEEMKELEGLNAALGDLHKSCDFLLKNFDARQEARAAEIDALREAKAILSGMAS